MTSFDIRTLKLSKTLPQNLLVQNIRQFFGLTEPPFDTIPDNFLLLAFSPVCNQDPLFIEPSTFQEILQTYGVCDHQTLEAYGDRILYSIITSIVYEALRLTTTPQILHKMMIFLSSNRLFTEIMLNKNVCKYVRTPNYPIAESSRFHNECADSFEALVAVLFFHLAESGYQNYFDLIKLWFLKNTDISFRIKDYLIRHHIFGFVYTIIDPNTLIPRIEQYKRSNQNYLDKLKPSLSEQQYSRLFDIFYHKLTLTIDDTISESVIIEPSDTLEQIYYSLGWQYIPPMYDSDLNIYYITGYPIEESIPIGIGNSIESAENDAIDHLLTLGYITLHKPVTKFFTY